MRTVPLLFALLAVGCSSSDPAGDAAAGGAVAGQDGGDGSIGCTDDPRAMTYAPGLTVTGKDKLFRIALVSSDPAPPARGQGSWSIRVEDVAGAPVASPTLGVTLFMPLHGHGSPVQPTITAQADGTYTVAPLDFFMPGLWEVTFDVTSGAQHDSVAFALCIEG